MSSGWVLLVVLALVLLPVAFLLYQGQRRELRGFSEGWRRSWEGLAEQTGMTLERLTVTGGPWWRLSGVLAGLEVTVELGLITYGWDALLMVRAKLPDPGRPWVLVVPAGQPAPMEDFVRVPHDGGFDVLAKERGDVAGVDEAALRPLLGAIPGAWLSLHRGGHDVVLELPVAELDRATLEAAVGLLKACARSPQA